MATGRDRARRLSDRICFERILTCLVTGGSWETAKQLIRHAASDTSLRTRDNEWVATGIFGALADETINASDSTIELDLSECSIDGSQHKAPCGGPGTGPNSDRGRSGWEWSLLADRNGIPIGWATNGGKLAVPLGMRWPIEHTNNWLSNYGQLCRSTDCRIELRLAQLAPTIAVTITIELTKWRNRWSPTRWRSESAPSDSRWVEPSVEGPVGLAGVEQRADPVMSEIEHLARHLMLLGEVAKHSADPGPDRSRGEQRRGEQPDDETYAAAHHGTCTDVAVRIATHHNCGKDIEVVSLGLLQRFEILPGRCRIRV